MASSHHLIKPHYAVKTPNIDEIKLPNIANSGDFSGRGELIGSFVGKPAESSSLSKGRGACRCGQKQWDTVASVRHCRSPVLCMGGVRQCGTACGFIGRQCGVVWFHWGAVWCCVWQCGFIGGQSQSQGGTHGYTHPTALQLRQGNAQSGQ